MEQHKVIFDTLDWESLQPGVRYKRYKSDNKQIRLVEYDKSFIEQVWCLKGHMGYVIEGEIEIDFNGNVANSWYFFDTQDEPTDLINLLSIQTARGDKTYQLTYVNIKLFEESEQQGD